MASSADDIIPVTDAIVKVRIIKAFESITCRSNLAFTPARGSSAKEESPLVCGGKSFLIDHSPSGKRIVFDIGIRKEDGEPEAPFLRTVISKFQVKYGPDTAETLRRGGMDPKSVDSIIWRHVFSYCGLSYQD
jgi:hypothetical protein